MRDRVLNLTYIIVDAVAPWHNSLADTNAREKSLLSVRFCGTKLLWYYLAMANLPATTPKNAVSEDYIARLAELVGEGQHPKDLARKLHPHDRAARRRTYMRLRRLALSDARLAQTVSDDAKLDLIVGLRPTVQALIRHARRRPDAAKLVLEASGFHNPRVSHEHSGEVNIKVTMPRPDFKSTQAQEPVVDADVVDDP